MNPCIAILIGLNPVILCLIRARLNLVKTIFDSTCMFTRTLLIINKYINIYFLKKFKI